MYSGDTCVEPYISGVADERDFYFSGSSLAAYTFYSLIIKPNEDLIINHLTDNGRKSSEAVKSINRVASVVGDLKTDQEILQLIDSNKKGGITGSANGLGVYNYGSEIYLTDSIGLGDPLLSKLPAIYDKYWRVGHMTREIPAGYEETLNTGINQIQNPSLHEFYDKLSMITKGELLCEERLQTIINMNLGKYDYLIDDYEKTLTTNYRG